MSVLLFLYHPSSHVTQDRPQTYIHSKLQLIITYGPRSYTIHSKACCCFTVEQLRAHLLVQFSIFPVVAVVAAAAEALANVAHERAIDMSGNALFYSSCDDLTTTFYTFMATNRSLSLSQPLWMQLRFSRKLPILLTLMLGSHAALIEGSRFSAFVHENPGKN